MRKCYLMEYLCAKVSEKSTPRTCFAEVTRTATIQRCILANIIVAIENLAFTLEGLAFTLATLHIQGFNKELVSNLTLRKHGLKQGACPE